MGARNLGEFGPQSAMGLSMNGQSVYVSSGAFKTRSVPEVVVLARNAGLHRIELGSGMIWAPDVLDAVRLTSGSPISYLVHNYFPPHENPFVLNLAASDAAVLEQSRAYCRQAIDLSRELGAPFFSVHAGFAFAAHPDQLGGDLTGAPRIPLERAQEIFVDSLRGLCAYAGQRAVRVLVENNVIARFNLVDGRNKLGLCATAEDILETYAAIDSPNLAFLIDVGHLKVTASALNFDMHTFLDHVGPYAAAFHLSDNDGTADQNRPFDDRAWFVPRLVEFPEATMIIEAYRLGVSQMLDVRRVIERARERVRAV